MVNKRCETILVVDDQQNWRDLLVNILESDGYEVFTASNFQEAKTLLNTKL
jgi:DNA-binding NtrC family response regulator